MDLPVERLARSLRLFLRRALLAGAPIRPGPCSSNFIAALLPDATDLHFPSVSKVASPEASSLPERRAPYGIPHAAEALTTDTSRSLTPSPRAPWFFHARAQRRAPELAWVIAPVASWWLMGAPQAVGDV